MTGWRIILKQRDGGNIFFNLWPEKHLGSMWDIASKEYHGGPQADHLSSVLTYIDIPKKYGEMYGDYGWNAEW